MTKGQNRVTKIYKASSWLTTLPENHVAEMAEAYVPFRHLDGPMIERCATFHVPKSLVPEHDVVVDPEVYRFAGARPHPHLQTERTLVILLSLSLRRPTMSRWCTIR